MERVFYKYLVGKIYKSILRRDVMITEIERVEGVEDLITPGTRKVYCFVSTDVEEVNAILAAMPKNFLCT